MTQKLLINSFRKCISKQKKLNRYWHIYSVLANFIKSPKFIITPKMAHLKKDINGKQLIFANIEEFWGMPKKRGKMKNVVRNWVSWFLLLLLWSGAKITSVDDSSENPILFSVSHCIASTTATEKKNSIYYYYNNNNNNKYFGQRKIFFAKSALCT